MLFLPLVIPLVAAGIMWGWLLSLTGLINQGLTAVGLGGVTRAWLGDFGPALPAVGVIGAWVLLGFCTVLLLTGMGKIDPALYESARIDGASWSQEFRSITVPCLRYEIGVCLTVTVIASLAAFDIVYISTLGGPGTATTVPGPRDLLRPSMRARSAWPPRSPSSLSLLVLVVVLPIQRSRARAGDDRQPSRGLDGQRSCSSSLMAMTIVPFVSLFTTAIHPSGAVPLGIAWPAEPQWGNFLEAFEVANMSALLVSSVLIVLGVVPVGGRLRDDGRLRHRPSCASPARVFCCSSSCFGLTLPLAGIIIPLYYVVREMGLCDTKLAIILPLIGLYMPFGVFWMRAHFLGMPQELSEAARVDGASTRDLFWRIHVPLARPPIASLGDPAVGLDVEPVPARARARRGSNASGPWRARWAPSRGSTPPTSRCWRPARSSSSRRRSSSSSSSSASSSRRCCRDR